MPRSRGRRAPARPGRSKWITETAEEIRLVLEEDNPEAVLFDGLDDALVGVGSQYTKRSLAVYSARKIIHILMVRDDMSYEDALDYYGFNIACLWAGEGTPIILEDI